MEFDEAAHSVLNFGIPDVCGMSSRDATVQAVEQRILAALQEFEPRIVKHTLAVKAVIDRDTMDHRQIVFEIKGELWAHPANVALYIKTEFDIESGHTEVLRGDV
jgi:type VI secretion system protein ImpF